MSLKPEDSQKCRPVKVVLKDTDTKMRILRKARNLRKSDKFKKVGISADKTLKERQADKVLVDERNRRREEGEDVVIYRGKVVTKQSLEEKKGSDGRNGAAGNSAGDAH